MSWQGRKPSDFSKTIKSDTEKNTKKIIILLVANLTTKTPVDTGRARSNWIVTSGKVTDEIAADEDKSGAPSRRSAEALSPIFGEVIFIQNNLPYIGYLETGTDVITAYAMVQRSIEATIRQARRSL